MKILKSLLVLFLSSQLYNCSSTDEECLKTITIPQFYVVGNQTYRYDTTQEVPCDVEEISDPINIAPPKLEGFTYEVISFNFTPDTGNNTSRLQFEIKLNNPNSYAVEGFPYLTIDTDGVQFSTNYSAEATSNCNKLNANSSCTFTYDKETPIDGTIGPNTIFNLISVEYFITKKL